MSVYVVTGGAGFIGSHLAARIGQAGHEVRVLDSLAGAASPARVHALASAPRVEIIQGDIRDPDVCRRVVEGADYVLHHAGEASVQRSLDDTAGCAAVNIGGTINLLEAARAAGSVKRFVFASSCAVYGDAPGAAKHEASLADPLSPYASTKLAGEHFCRNFFRLYGLQTVALRYFNVYGPGQDPAGDYASVVPRFLLAVARGEAPVLYGDGEQSRDFIFVDDVVEANLRAVAATRGVGGRVVNVGSGRSASLGQVLQILEQIVGHSVEAERRPPRPGDIKHSRADIAAAAGLLQFTPSVSLRDGLERSLQWYQTEGIEGNVGGAQPPLKDQI